MSSAEIDRKVLAAAFLRVQELTASTQPVEQSEVLRLEETLRPLAPAKEIRQAVVPLLDRARLFGLAMAWDSGPEPKGEAWLLARIDRWIALGAPEFAFITLCELNRLNAPVEDAKQRALDALESERRERAPVFEKNLAALDAVDAELASSLRKVHRLSVSLRPLGAGLAEFAGPGQPWAQLWAVTPSAAVAEAQRLMQQVSAFADSFIAGVGDCSLPAAAAALETPQAWRVHLVDLQLSRVRALLEICDLSEALRSGRLRLHGGPRALRTLAPYAPLALKNEASIVGGDPVAVSLLKAAADPDAPSNF